MIKCLKINIYYTLSLSLCNFFWIFFTKDLHCINQEYIFALAFRERAVSSVGSEHLVYTQGVGSSSLSPPTKGLQFGGLFLCAFSKHFMNYVYILYSRLLDRYYIGYCGTSVADGLAKHLSNHKGYTGRAKDWIICYTLPKTSSAPHIRHATRHDRDEWHICGERKPSHMQYGISYVLDIHGGLDGNGAIRLGYTAGHPGSHGS